jgi:hypothetical protein
VLCTPWIDTDSITQCSLDVDDDGTVEPADLAKADAAVLVASGLLYEATAQMFPGICTTTIRPCSTGAGWGQALDYPANVGGSRVLADTVGGCTGCLTSIVCDGKVWPAVDLPHRPVVDVLEVTIDGDPFVDFRIVDNRYLIRNDGGPWPTRNDLGQEAWGPGAQPGTWQIEWRWGSAPPAYLAHAAELLACEFIAAWCTEGDCPECNLPSRLQSITYEGATAAVLDPFDFMDSGGFGIPQIDYAVRAANPGGLQRNGRVVLPRDVSRTGYSVRPA